MLRVAVLLLLPITAGLIQPGCASQPISTFDPAFQKIPFEQWLSEPNQQRFHWTVNVGRAQLSFHQRLVSAVEIEVNGRDLESRRNDGDLVTFFQVTDRQGVRYQGHGDIQLGKLDPNVKDATIQTSQRGFFLPGDYQLAAALLDTGTGEHSATQTRFRINAPSSRFLLDAWRELPAVEFIREKESPDSWYRSDIAGRVKWLAPSNGPARLDVILNVAPTVPVPGTRATPSEGLPALLPTLKVLTQTGAGELFQHIELLDLGRRRSVFEDNLRHAEPTLDWPRLKVSLSDANTASIDVHALADRHHDAQFFVTQVRRILRAAGAGCVLVILTTSVAFEPGEDLDPVSLESLPNCRVFYIRYHEAPERGLPPFPPGMRGRGRSLSTGLPMGPGFPNRINVADQLASTLKPLSPKVFDVETAGEMTKVLAEVQKAMAK